MTTSSPLSAGYEYPPSSDEIEPVNTKLDQLFHENPGTQEIVDFKYNPSNEKPIPRPQPRRPGGQYQNRNQDGHLNRSQDGHQNRNQDGHQNRNQNGHLNRNQDGHQNRNQDGHQNRSQIQKSATSSGPVVVTLGNSFPIDFTKLRSQNASISVVNGETLIFTNSADGNEIASVSISSSVMKTLENSIVIFINGSIFCSFIGYWEISAKLMAIYSAKQVVDPLVFSEGEGEQAFENYRILYRKLTFEFSNNEFKSRNENSENGKNQLRLTSDVLQDPFLKNFLGKKPGATFAVGINGVGTVFELRKHRLKKKE